jgi:hypothetical protein
MNNRSHVAGGTVAVIAALTLAVTGAEAAPPLPQPENSLLGIHLMSRFSDVLSKFGQPTDIQVGSPVAPTAPDTAAPGMGGANGPMGGAPGMGRMGGMPGMPGGMMGRMGGAPMGMSGPGGLPGFAGGSSAMSGRQYMMQQGRGGGMPGGPPMGMVGGGGKEGPPTGMMGRMGGMPGMGLPGFQSGNTTGLPGGIGSGATPQTEENGPADTTWWYRYPKTGLYYAFLFNKDGRVIQIQEFGWAGGKGSATRQGITLGASLGDLVRKYGWSEDGEKAGSELTLRYGDRARLAFQLVKNKVAGITLAVVH